MTMEGTSTIDPERTLDSSDALNLMASIVRGYSVIVADVVRRTESGELLSDDSASDAALFIDYAGRWIGAELDALAAVEKRI